MRLSAESVSVMAEDITAPNHNDVLAEQQRLANQLLAEVADIEDD